MMKRLLCLLFVLVTAPAFGAISLLAPGDNIIAVDSDGLVSFSSYPAAEAPVNVLDETATTKYLNFAKTGTGFIVTPAAPSTVQSFTLTTANDSPPRDPASYEIYGTNDPITSTDNSMGNSESWTLIDSGTVSLPDDRLTLAPVIPVSNSTMYASYKVVFPTVKDAGAANSMQVADVTMYWTTDGTGPAIASTSDPILAIHTGAQDSRYPAAEFPANILDGDSSTKYLNFGKLNTGFIVTPAAGSTIVDSFQLTTANDSPERDPASFLLYGTNDVIMSLDNTEGTAESWTLIASGDITLPDDRLTMGDVISIANSTAYTSYKMLFPTLKDGDAANSMQVADVQFFGVPEPATLCLLGFGGLAMLRRRR